jgi:hypothetical protein
VSSWQAIYWPLPLPSTRPFFHVLDHGEWLELFSGVVAGIFSSNVIKQIKWLSEV